MTEKYEKITKAITVFDKEGDGNASLTVFYDGQSSVIIKQIALFDGAGKKTRNVKQSEIQDVPVYESYLLFSDCRMKFFKPVFPEYPYTVEYTYEIKSTDNLSVAYWRPQEGYNLSVEHARLEIRRPKVIQLRSRTSGVFNHAAAAAGASVSETWSLDNALTIEEEPFAAPLSERTPSVSVIPKELVSGGYRGNATDWREFGKWFHELFKGRDALPDALRSKIASLVIAIPDTLERIKALYAFLQNNTRYVGVELGIGRFQPFDARTVFETGYGDCKALSNYFHSLLKCIGVRSYPALVNAGQYGAQPFDSFPDFHQFNHVILCIPFRADTIWIECTDPKLPFGFLGNFTDDREALLISEGGGKFAHTTTYAAGNNVQTRVSRFTIDTCAAALCSTVTNYTGLQCDDLIEAASLNEDEQKKWLYESTNLPAPDLRSFSITCKRQIPHAIVNESWMSRHYGSFSGNYMILPLNLIDAQKPIQKMLKKRHSDVLVKMAWTDQTTSLFRIPPGYRIESMPEGKIVRSKFGDYSFSTSASGTEVTYNRKLTIQKGRYGPWEYEGFREFISSVSKADEVKLLLVKNRESLRR
jgi:hypothetical protein